MMPPTIGSAIAMASFQPVKPEDVVVVVDEGTGPAIKVLLNIAGAFG